MNAPNLTFLGNNVDKDQNDNFQLYLVTHEIARHNPESKFIVYVSPREPDGSIEWTLRESSATTGHRTHELTQRAAKGTILLNNRTY